MPLRGYMPLPGCMPLGGFPSDICHSMCFPGAIKRSGYSWSWPGHGQGHVRKVSLHKIEPLAAQDLSCCCLILCRGKFTPIDKYRSGNTFRYFVFAVFYVFFPGMFNNDPW
eukprot:jgi/Botrbrau1/20843/Bobra.0156s0068.1